MAKTLDARLDEIDVDAIIARESREIELMFHACGPHAELLFESLRNASRGGKRLRSKLLLTAWDAYTRVGGVRKRVIPTAAGIGLLAAAVEVFQTSALIHDDLIDESASRRGMPTVHEYFANLHIDNHWIGHAQQFGQAGALLAGDLALIESAHLFQLSLGASTQSNSSQLREMFTLMRSEVMVGQFLDTLSPHLPWPEPDQVEAEAWAVLRAKSARYSVVHPLALGAAAAGATESELLTLREFGLPLGEAFQMRDDVLGVFGDPEVTGKPAGDDLREGKRTLLVAYALQRLDERAGREFRDLVGQNLPAVQIAYLRDVILSCGALDAMEEAITKRYDLALTTLEKLDISEEHRSFFRTLAKNLTVRDS